MTSPAGDQAPEQATATEPRRPILSYWLASLAALLAIAAAFSFNPIGFGNGPLRMGSNVTVSQSGLGPAPYVLDLGVDNAGKVEVSVDSVRFLGATGYPVPRLITLRRVKHRPDCAGLWAIAATKPKLTIHGCAFRDQGPLIGMPFDPGHGRAIAELIGPRLTGCWAILKMVVRYHVGIRHYAATYPMRFAACGKGVSAAALNAAELQVSPSD